MAFFMLDGIHLINSDNINFVEKRVAKEELRDVNGYHYDDIIHTTTVINFTGGNVLSTDTTVEEIQDKIEIANYKQNRLRQNNGKLN
jgi:hypothetical protein